MATVAETVDETVTPYNRAYRWARAHEMPEWETASTSAWATLDAIAMEHQRGERDWTDTVRLLARLVGDVIDAHNLRGYTCQVCGNNGHAETLHGVTLAEPYGEPEDPRISAAEDRRDFPEDNGREVW